MAGEVTDIILRLEIIENTIVTAEFIQIPILILMVNSALAGER
jgi:hypothetical protein